MPSPCAGGGDVAIDAGTSVRCAVARPSSSTTSARVVNRQTTIHRPSDLAVGLSGQTLPAVVPDGAAADRRRGHERWAHAGLRSRLCELASDHTAAFVKGCWRQQLDTLNHSGGSDLHPDAEAAPSTRGVYALRRLPTAAWGTFFAVQESRTSRSPPTQGAVCASVFVTADLHVRASLSLPSCRSSRSSRSCRSCRS